MTDLVEPRISSEMGSGLRVLTVDATGNSSAASSPAVASNIASLNIEQTIVIPRQQVLLLTIKDKQVGTFVLLIFQINVISCRYYSIGFVRTG